MVSIALSRVLLEEEDGYFRSAVTLDIQAWIVIMLFVTYAKNT